MTKIVMLFFYKLYFLVLEIYPLTKIHINSIIMKAIVLNNAGKAENLEIAEVDVPKIKDNEVLVKVSSIGINPIDIKGRATEGVLSFLLGEKRPAILGWDISGTVTETGKEVTDLVIGDDVYGMVNFPGLGNAYAEFVAAPATHIVKKSSHISHVDAAASSMAALTAWQLLVIHGKVKKGDRVLIHAAAGGVGHFAVQIAKHLGAHVIGTSSAGNKDFILDLGADEHIDYTAKPFDQDLEPVDFVIDTVGKDTLTRSIDVVKPGGSIATIVTAQFSESDLQKAKDNDVNLINFFVRSNPEAIKSVAELVESGVIKPHIFETFDFQDIVQAHLQIETGKTVGKIVITVN